MINGIEKEQILNRVEREYCWSIRKYGNWDNKSFLFMIWIILCELMEVVTALIKCDYYGPHGMFSELSQVVACCEKCCVQILRRKAQSNGTERH